MEESPAPHQRADPHRRPFNMATSSTSDGARTVRERCLRGIAGWIFGCSPRIQPAPLAPPVRTASHAAYGNR